MLASRGDITDRLRSMPMDLSWVIDVLLHLDKHLAAMAQAWGPWIYAALFAVIFVETGLVVMPFLPGDSLLFG